MKSLKLLSASLLALSASSMAFAYGNPAGHVNVTGSTAFRAAANAAIIASFDAAPAYAYSGANLGASNQAVFIGNVGGHSVTVKTSFQGSIGGVRAVAANTAPTLSPYYTDAQAAASAVPGGQQIGSAAAAVELADFALSDSDVGEVPRLVGGGTLNSSAVGVIVFKFLAAKGSNAGINNVTALQFRGLINANNGLPLSFWTGNSANSGVRVYPTGRDDDSGTRLVAFQETGVGAGATTTVHQFQLLPADQNVTPTGFQIWPKVAGHPSGSGLNGYWGFVGGGNVRTELSRDVSALPAALNFAGEIGYISEADAAGALTAGAIELPYNGQAFGAAAIQEGKYTFWGYEWVVIDPTQANADAQQVAANMVNAIKNPGFVEGFGVGLSLSSMHVGRSASGATVTEGSRF